MNAKTMLRRVFMATVLVTAAVGVSNGTPAQAAPPNHCVITVGDTDAEGNFIIEDTTCYDTFFLVLKAKGAIGISKSVSPKSVSSALLLSVGIIATHYDGASASGASVSVQGSDCSGGGLNLPASWNDRISSTTNGCPTIAHYENTGYSGTTLYTFTVGANTNLTGYMDNRTSSVKYFS